MKNYILWAGEGVSSKNKIIGTKSLLYNTTVSFMLNFTVTEIWFK